MKLWCSMLAASVLVAAAPPVEAKTLRWSARGDTQSMDPYAVNEGVSNNINQLVYDRLVELDRQQQIVPALASRWEIVDRTTWRFHLRRDVRFHDGTPMTADDVVFSIERSQQPTSQHAVFTRRLGKAVRIDEHTIELRQEAPNPLLLENALNAYVMSRAWCIANRVERVPNANEHQEAYSSHHTMGTGAWILQRREPGVRTVFKRNTRYWRALDGNVEEVVFMPIGHDATRTAALVAGDIDFTQDLPPQDAEMLAGRPEIRITTGPENRLLFFGMDVARDELPHASVKGRNPFRDARVREAFARAIDAQAIRSKVMRNQSDPTACMSSSVAGCHAPELETRPAANLTRARALMAEAGYRDGFRLTLDCPNDRYVNDQAICLAVASMLARIGVSVKVDARTKSLFFPKVLKRDTSFYLYGWGGNLADPALLLDPLLHSTDPSTQKGSDNNGGVADAELDHLLDAAAVEMDRERRRALLGDAQRLVNTRHYTLPLHRQRLAWASRAAVRPVITPGNVVRVDWFRVD